jgi:hypothetical protein
VFGNSVGAIGVSDMVFPSGNEPKTISRCSLEVGPVTLIAMGACEIRNFVPKRTLLLARCCQHGLNTRRSGTDFHDALRA